MNLILCITTLCSMVIYSESSLTITCLGHPVHLDSKPFMAVFSKILPVARLHKCLYECLLRDIGLLTADGLIDREIFIKKLRSTWVFDMPTVENIDKIVEKCNINELGPEADKCDIVARILHCAVPEAEKYGINGVQMLNAFRVPYMHKDKGVLVWVDSRLEQ